AYPHGSTCDIPCKRPGSPGRDGGHRPPVLHRIPENDNLLAGYQQHIHLVYLLVLLIVKTGKLEQNMVPAKELSFDTFNTAEPHQKAGFRIPRFEKQFTGDEFHSGIAEIY